MKVASDLDTMATQSHMQGKVTRERTEEGGRWEEGADVQEEAEPRGSDFPCLAKPRLDSMRLSWTLIINLPLLN